LIEKVCFTLLIDASDSEMDNIIYHRHMDKHMDF